MTALFDFFEKIEKEKWSGEVHVTSSQGHAYLVLKEGQFLWSYRPLDRAIERLEKIDWLHLPPVEILSSTRTWEDLVRDLLSVNHDQYPRLIRYLRVDRLEIFFRIFFWTNVELHPKSFQVEVPDPVTFEFYNPRRIKSLLEEARTRLKDWPHIQERMGNSRRIFVSSIVLPEAEPSIIDEVDRALSGQEERSSNKGVRGTSPYSPEEIEILRLCDGTLSVQDIIKRSDDGEMLVLRRMLNLWNKGAIRPKDEQASDRHEIRHVLKKEESRWYHTLWVIVWVSTISCLLSILQGLTPPIFVVPTQVAQAIEGFRHRHGHYPLSLEELRREPLLRGLQIEMFDYRLKGEDDYQILIKK